MQYRKENISVGVDLAKIKLLLMFNFLHPTGLYVFFFKSCEGIDSWVDPIQYTVGPRVI